ncbi:MAG: metallophosphoesterase [Candidatus Helarchaeota archaeon]
MSRKKELPSFKNTVFRFLFSIGIIIGLISLLFLGGIGPWLQTPNLKGPYLSWESDPKTTMTISWETPEYTNASVQWGKTTSYGNKAASSVVVGNLRSVTLTGLEPDTTYHYRVISEIKNYTQLVEDHFFKTAPNSTQPFSFIAYGDSRPDIFGNGGHGIVCNQIMKKLPNPAFVLHTGDIVFQSNFEQHWDRFFYEAKDIIDHAPLFTTLGNHEYNEFGGDMGYRYFNYFHYPNNEWYYSFNYSNAHIICLNLSVSDVEISTIQKNWLINDLSKVNSSSDINWIIIFFHVPLYSSGGFGDDPLAIEALEQIFIDYKVELVIMGHDHQYERMYINGIQYIVAGGGGSELEVYIGGNENVQYSENIHHFCQIDVNGLSLTVKTISSLGAIIDRFSLTSKHP